MSSMFEVYYKEPPDENREGTLVREVARFGGSMTGRETPVTGDPSRAIVLTFEFPELVAAENAAAHLRLMGEHVENIQEDYPD